MFFQKNPLQDLLSSLNAPISRNESTLIITDHVIYNPAYTYKFHLKTTHVVLKQSYLHSTLTFDITISYPTVEKL